MLHRPILWLALILVTPLAPAQEPDSRAQREASNPLRMIIEAAKIKPRPRNAEPVRLPEKSVARPVAEAASANRPTAAARAQEQAVPLPEVSPAVAPAGPPESTVATVEIAAPAAAPDPAPVALQLANRVEPVTPRSLVGKLHGEVLLHVAFTVNADGTVSDAAVLRSTHPQMDEAVLEAVRQWRYQPIAAARAHEVQLVLRQPD